MASWSDIQSQLFEKATYTDKQIKMAYGIINDPRWKSGNMTTIVKKIEQIAKGLSKHPGVVKALRVTNEDTIVEAKGHAAADELLAYAKKNGGIDKKDFQKAAGYINNYRETGSPRAIADLVKLINNLDTEPMEKIVSVLHKNDPSLAKSVMRKAGIKLREEVELEEAAPKISTGKAKGSIKATGLRGKGMKKFDVDVSVKNGKFEFRITDESGRFQTVGLKQAAKMLGESVEDLESFAKENFSEGVELSTINEKLTVPMGVEAWIRDFLKSDAPQFQGKSKDDKIKMAVAAFAAAEDEMKKAGKKEKPVKEALELDERSPWGDLKVMLGKKFNKNYEKALKWMKDTGKSAADAERMFRGTDARELQKMYDGAK